MEIKQKECKGINKATKGLGCKTPSYERTYGLCNKCLREWAIESEAGKEWLKKQTAYKMKKNKAEKKKEDRALKRELNSSGAMKLADTYFSRFIRLSHSIDSNCTCYTCGAIRNIKDVDNGHFEKRAHTSTRYHEDNCRPQCKICNGNTKHNGKQKEFRAHLCNEIGEEEVVKIEQLARTTIKASTKFYRDIADYYREKVNELQKELGVKYW